MPDREKVMAGLVTCIAACNGKTVCLDCWYMHDYSGGCEAQLLTDALALLKAQEPKLVHVTADINHRKIGECPTCGKWINSGDYPNYCGHCGQAVKWE